PPEQRKSKKKMLAVMLVVLLLIGGSGVVSISFLREGRVEEMPIESGSERIVLSDTISMTFRVSTQAVFDSVAGFADVVTFDGPVTFTQGLSMSNLDLDLGTGAIIAANIPESFINALSGGDGVSVT